MENEFDKSYIDAIYQKTQEVLAKTELTRRMVTLAAAAFQAFEAETSASAALAVSEEQRDQIEAYHNTTENVMMHDVDLAWLVALDASGIGPQKIMEIWDTVLSNRQPLPQTDESV